MTNQSIFSIFKHNIFLIKILAIVALKYVYKSMDEDFPPLVDMKLCNIFELVFTLCHKCIKYNCLPWKMLYHAGNSYITRQKQLCHPPDTVMLHRKQLYHPLVY